MFCLFCKEKMKEEASEMVCVNKKCLVKYGKSEKFNTARIKLPLTIHLASCDKVVDLQIFINQFSESCYIDLDGEEVYKNYLSPMISYQEINSMIVETSKSMEVLGKIKLLCEKLYIHRAIW